jgi:ABC-type sugar transport system ATPase subunit
MMRETESSANGSAHATRTPRLATRAIKKSFGGIPVLRGVSFDVACGEIHGLVGQNGAGKSTLTRVLAGGYPDYRGKVEIDGTPVGLRSPHQAMGHGVSVIYQEFSLVPQLSVAENIVLGTEPGRIAYRARAIRSLATRLLERAGMVDDVPLDAHVGELSTSMQQRVEIAKALSRKARVLILDEPTARLAGPDRERLFGLMRRIAASGTALIFISHILEEILRITSRLTVLRDGSVAAAGPSATFDAVSLSSALMGEALERQEAQEARQPSGPLGKAVLTASRVAAGRQVKDVSLTLGAGEIVGLAGLIGSGRSTLAKSLVGAVPLSAGSLELHGRAVRFKNPRQALRAGVALIPEDRRAQGLVGALPASENVVMMSLARGGSRLGFVRTGRLSKLASDAMADLEVRPADVRRAASTYSGGNQQKLLLARALLADTDVLVIDQPTAGVDVGTKAQIHRILRNAAKQGKAILIVSDEIDELLALSDSLLIMRGGRLTAELHGHELNRNRLLALMAARTQDAA